MRLTARFFGPSFAAVALLLRFSAPASADVFEFGCITLNSPSDCAILQAQLRMEVTAGTISGANAVNFRFTNSGPASSSVTDIYFSDLLPAILGTPLLITDSGAGVSFRSGCNPGRLPGGQPYGFTSSYCAESTAPTQPMGVNPGEWLNIGYTLLGGATLQDVVGAIIEGDYRVGIHVQGFAGGGSESAITAHRVPEPGTLLLLGAGTILLPLTRRLRVRAR